MTLADLQKLAETDPQRIRVMVAELRGWRWSPTDRLWSHRQKPHDLRTTSKLPLLSLDDMAEREAGLTDEEHAAFQGWLILVCEGKRTVSASALDRAIAYILTKTKGDDRE